MGKNLRSFAGRLVILAGVITAALVLFLSVDWGEKFATDVSQLLPASEVDDATAALLSSVREKEERLVLGVLEPPPDGWGNRREAAADALLRSLRESGRFEQVAEGAGPSDPDALTATIYQARLDLLLAPWAEAAGLSLTEPDPGKWVEAILDSLEDFLTQPEAAVLSELIPADPFPLAAYMAERAPVALEEVEAGPFLFWAVQTASPFVPEGQDPILEALEQSEEAAGEVLSGTKLRHASVAAFARDSENRIRREITWLNAVGILAVGLVVFVCLRRRILLAHLVVLAALSVAGGLAAVVLMFPVVHVLSLVVGGLLVGVAVDYGIHILMHRTAGEDGSFTQTLREVRKPLLAGALSTAAGFAALTFAELPLLRQIGVFVAGGLLTALMVSWLYLPLWRRPHDIARGAVANLGRSRWPAWVRSLGVIVMLLSLAGWLRLEWKDDLRELQPPMPERWEADAEVRSFFSQGESYSSWLCLGEGPREARASLAAFEQKWETAGGRREDLLSLGPWIAEPEKRDAVRALFERMPEFSDVFRERFEEAGFDADAFEPFLDLLDEWLSAENPSYESRVARVAGLLDGPGGMLLRETDNGWWFMVSVPGRAIPEGWTSPEGSIGTDQLETLNELFSQYRRTAWRLSGVALAFIAAGVLMVYGPAAGSLSLLLPMLAWGIGMGALAGLFTPLNLFHLLGGFLGFCVALDYGLFFRHARASGRRLPVSIRVSAATTLSAFGVLAWATIPAVSALGSSVFAVVLAAWFMVEAAAGFSSKEEPK